jgi:NAD dependent epimerase/dehydratase
MNWQGKQVLVTGAGGFIGSHLVEALVRAGAKVRATLHYNSRDDRGHLTRLDRAVQEAVEIRSGDLGDTFWIRRAVEGCQVVFHLGALIAIPYSYHAPQSYVVANMEGTLNVLEACRSQGVERLLHTSTSEVYGTAQYTPIDEKHPLHAQSPYAATKVGADQLAYSYFASFGTPVVIVRPFNNYGPRQSARAVIPTIISQALAGDEIKLGSVSPVRDFLFVEDTARGFMAAAAGADDTLGEVFNLGTGTGVTIGQTVDRIAKILGKTLHVKSDEQRNRPAKSEVLALLCSAEKAKARLGWKPDVDLDTGLKRTIDWMSANRDLYRPDQYTI